MAWCRPARAPQSAACVTARLDGDGRGWWTRADPPSQRSESGPPQPSPADSEGLKGQLPEHDGRRAARAAHQRRACT